MTEDACSYAIDLQTDSLPAELAEITAFVAAQTQDYIWHRESFNLHIEGSRLLGKTAVGDCIDDEWFIVWLLRQVTELKPSVVASIIDNDGHFLLIEAADVLPKWVTPANAENRVYVFRGHLHLVPIDYKSQPPVRAMEDDEGVDEDGYISIEEAARLVRDAATPTEAPSEVEALVWKRIAGYPGRIVSEHMHNTLALIPTDIAAALRANPQLVSSAVQTFYERDPQQVKACQFMSRFSPSAPSNEVLVRMTRPLYAQLIAQRFFPPKSFEKAAWYGDALPETPKYRQRDVGMKLTCGFEMLYQETIASLKTVRLPRSRDPAYERFRTRLTELGYFRGEMEGSAAYQNLEMAARARYEELPTSASFASDVERAIALAANLPELPAGSESDDSWLNLRPEELEEMLRQKDEGRAQDDETVAQAEADKLAGFAERLGRFVDGEGSMEGALFEDEASDDDSDDSDEEMVPTQLEREARLAELVPALPETDWGRKPVQTEALQPSLEKAPPEERLTSLEKSDKYDGASDDDDNDEPEESDDDRPTLEGEGDVDIASEMDDFLRFTREALGLSEDQYGDILSSRKERGAFVPSNKPGKMKATSTELPPVPPSMRPSHDALRKQAQAANPHLDSFDALMDAMDAELAKAKATAPPTQTPAPVDEDAQMDAELAELLPREQLGPGDLTLMKNFLESFRAQQGAGPVGNLAGRMGVQLSDTH